MGKQSSLPGREEVLRKMYSLAGVRFNDVVRLAFLTQEQAAEGCVSVPTPAYSRC